MKRYALVDCNNFFVSCERLFRPDLTERPTAVLSNNDGCIIARSNEVKDLGVMMGVPLFKVRSLLSANNATLFSANFELYGDISQRIITLLREETPLIEVYSIDECFIDLSEIDIKDAEAWGKRLKGRVMREIGMPISVGIASTKTLAKVAATFSKTHGEGVLAIDTDAQRLSLLSELPIQDIWGVGWRMAPKLLDKGVSRASQLTEASDAWLRQQFNITGMKMIDELRGTARLQFGDKQQQRQSIKRSRSFGHTIRTYHHLESAIATFTAQAATRLRAQDSVARGIVVFLSTGKRDIGRPYTSILMRLPEATADTGRLIVSALEGLDQLYDPEFGYKKAGVTLVDLKPLTAWQLSMVGGDTDRDKHRDLMKAVDRLNRRYGPIVWHGSENRASSASWHSKRQLRSPRYTTAWLELPTISPQR